MAKYSDGTDVNVGDTVIGKAWSNDNKATVGTVLAINQSEDNQYNILIGYARVTVEADEVNVTSGDFKVLNTAIEQ